MHSLAVNSSEPSSHAAGERQLRIALLACFLLAGAAAIVGARMRGHHGDFDIYRRASNALYTHPARSLYEAEPGYVYPPFLAVTIRPLVALADPWGGLIWDLARWMSFGVALLLCERLLRSEVSARAGAAIVLVCLIAGLRPMWYDTLNGNSNAFLLLAMVAGWWFLERGHPPWSGVCWALMLSVKPASAPVILAPLIRRRSGPLRCWLAAILVLLAANLILPAALFGWRSAWTQLTGFPSGAESTPDDVFSRYSNQSLGLGACRALARLGWLDPESATTAQVRWARAISGVLLLAWIGLLFLRTRRLGDRSRVKWGVAILGVAGALVSPVVWITHYLMLIPAYVALLGEAARKMDLRSRVLSGGATLFAVTLISFKAAILNTLVWAPLALLVALTVFIAWEHDHPTEAGTRTDASA